MPIHPQPLYAAPEDLEIWKNAGAATIVLKKANQLGHWDEAVVHGGRTVNLTPHERRVNEESIPDQQFNPFRNGMLAAVRLIDSEEDTEELKANSNAMSETAMKALFKSQIKTFTAKVGEITNPITLRRLQEVASEIDASMRQAEVIKARLDEVAPSMFDGQSSKSFSGMGAVAPK